jgi:hypothetical protein
MFRAISVLLSSACCFNAVTTEDCEPKDVTQAGWVHRKDVGVGTEIALGMRRALIDIDRTSALKHWQQLKAFSTLNASSSSGNRRLAQIGVCRRGSGF